MSRREPPMNVQSLITRIDHLARDRRRPVRRIQRAIANTVVGQMLPQPFDIRLAYLDRHWLTVRCELGRDEVGSTEEVEIRLANDIVELFTAIGLAEPAPLPVLALEHQIAQKLHACTSVNQRGGNERAHDLVDLQILEQEERIDMATADAVCLRLFAARRAHGWPPIVQRYEVWDTLYADAAEGLEVVENVELAVEWANDVVARAVEAGTAAA